MGWGARGTAQASEVLATRPRAPRLWWLVVIFVVQTASWLLQALAEGGTLRWLLVVVCGLGAVVTGAAQRGAPPALLRLTDDEVRLEKRWRRPLVVRREDVTDVRGDVVGRLTWSHATLVESADATLTLKDLDQPPSVLVPRLREWAGLATDPG
ncbi:hypothetical protein [Cellulomonas marina]|uniref:PH domain-containing protein n=1 Tax=Cellulomonas marina TaxID=988821 RepID=A0A1I1AR33_9CELL|nr:hypothetical protein [Cellulomonas marina]GIG30463.1 hypothetical protein Cma02nite_30630 [Cellulomonas marina]SFB38938.1 hypothetical protein SAMN05421867_1203 [Cellulomonas marina]